MEVCSGRHWLRSLALRASVIQRVSGRGAWTSSGFLAAGSGSSPGALAVAPLACVLARAHRARLLSRLQGSRKASSTRGGPVLTAGCVSGAAACPVVDVVSGEPLILAIDGLCSAELIAELRHTFQSQVRESLVQTNAYVDDMFEEARAVEEDAHFLRCVVRCGARVPDEYRYDPLRSFLWAAATRRASLADSDVATARLALMRRAWQRQWNSDDIAKSGFKKAAKRWKVPESMLRCLAPVVAQVLGTGVQGVVGSEELCDSSRSDVSWVLRDSTVVRYQAGESQVPHIDTCDVTMLVYLSDTGGSTCFPNIGCRIAPSAGRVLVFFSTTPEATRFGGFAGSAYGRPNESTMHYGGLDESGEQGEKLIVQLLVSANNMGSASTWRDVLRGSAFRSGTFTAGQQSLPLVQSKASDSSARSRSALALSPLRCASRCVDNALDFATQAGGAKYCIHCWSRFLEKTLPQP